jgi:ubiquinone/menaquinone biosynthesis C-methylase UbiE
LGAKQLVGDSGHVVGIDLSSGMLNVAKCKAKAQNLDILFIEHDIADLNGLDILSKNSTGFDVITCAAALILLQDPVQAVRHWRSFLRPGGRVITDVQTKDANLVMNILAAIAPTLGVTVPWEGGRWQSLEQLEQVMTEGGLRVEQLFETDAYKKTRYHSAEATDFFEQAISKPMYKNFGQDSIREKAKALFVETFANIADAAGFVDEECRYWMVIASKST